MYIYIYLQSQSLVGVLDVGLGGEVGEAEDGEVVGHRQGRRRKADGSWSAAVADDGEEAATLEAVESSHPSRCVPHLLLAKVESQRRKRFD